MLISYQSKLIKSFIQLLDHLNYKDSGKLFKLSLNNINNKTINNTDCTGSSDLDVVNDGHSVVTSSSIAAHVLCSHLKDQQFKFMRLTNNKNIVFIIWQKCLLQKMSVVIQPFFILMAIRLVSRDMYIMSIFYTAPTISDCPSNICYLSDTLELGIIWRSHDHAKNKWVWFVSAANSKHRVRTRPDHDSGVTKQTIFPWINFQIQVII